MGAMLLARSATASTSRRNPSSEPRPGAAQLGGPVPVSLLQLAAACCRGGPPRRRQAGLASLRHRPYGLYHVRPGPYDVDATSTLYQRHGWDIHALYIRGSRVVGTYHQSRQPAQSAKALPPDDATAVKRDPPVTAAAAAGDRGQRA